MGIIYHPHKTCSLCWKPRMQRWKGTVPTLKDPLGEQAGSPFLPYIPPFSLPSTEKVLCFKPWTGCNHPIQHHKWIIRCPPVPDLVLDPGNTAHEINRTLASGSSYLFWEKKKSLKKWANTRGSKELCFLHKTGWCDKESLGAGWSWWSRMASCQWMNHNPLLRWSDGTVTGQTLTRITESTSHMLRGPRGGSKDFCSGWRCSEGMPLGEEGFWLWLLL